MASLLGFGGTACCSCTWQLRLASAFPHPFCSVWRADANPPKDGKGMLVFLVPAVGMRRPRVYNKSTVAHSMAYATSQAGSMQVVCCSGVGMSKKHHLTRSESRNTRKNRRNKHEKKKLKCLPSRMCGCSCRSVAEASMMSIANMSAARMCRRKTRPVTFPKLLHVKLLAEPATVPTPTACIPNTLKPTNKHVSLTKQPNTTS